MTDLEATVAEVASKKVEWANVSYKEKLDILRSLKDEASKAFDDWFDVSCQIRNWKTDGSQPHLASAGVVPLVFFGFWINNLILTYKHLVKFGTPPPPSQVREYKDQKIVTVFPRFTTDKLFASGSRGDVWLMPGAETTQGRSLQQQGLVVVLAPGNYEAPIDCLHKLFAENKVVVYKTNPINAANTPIIERIFRVLIDRGFFAIVSGGAEVGSQLVNDPAVDEVLITGSAATFDRIVWGSTKEDIEQNKAAGKRLVAKPVHAELGGVGPAIIVPGTWTYAEVTHIAAQIAAGMTMNGGHVCAAMQVLVVDKDWPQRTTLLDAIRAQLNKLRHPIGFYYPGFADRLAKFAKVFPNAETFGDEAGPVLIPDAPADSIAVTEESFASLLSEVALEGCGGTDPDRFLGAAVDFCNTKVWGSLSATVFIDTRTQATLGPALEAHIAALRYGSIGVNEWAALNCMLGTMWGAFPGHPDTDIQSGSEFLGPLGMYDHPQKVVWWSSFVSPTHTVPYTGAEAKLTRMVAYYALEPGWRSILSTLRVAMLGL